MQYYVYILATKDNKVIYTGITNNLPRRIYEHKNSADPKNFTFRYRVSKLVYYEVTTDAVAAIEREKQIKSWSRARKNKLIENQNPQWKELYESILA